MARSSSSSSSASLRALVLAVVVLVVLAPVAAVFVLDLVTRGADSRMREAVDRAAREAAEGLTGGQDPATVFGRVAPRHRVRLRLVGADGAVILDVDHNPKTENSLGVTSMGADTSSADLDSGRPPMARRAEVKGALAAGLYQRCEAILDGRRLRCQTVVRVNRAKGAMLVMAEKSAVRSLQRLVDVQRPLMLLTIFTLVAGLLLAWWLMRRVVHPLEDLRREVVSRSARTRPSTRPVELVAPPEVADVVSSFNTLLQSLETQRNATESFMADLAHELKSPLAALRTSMELLADGELEPETRQRLSGAVQASVRRMDATIVELLELARAEAGVPQEQRQELDLSLLVRQAVEAFADERPVDGPRFETEAPAPKISVQGAPAALTRALNNLLDNAAAHASTGVCVSVTSDQLQAVVRVADDGPGFPPDDLPRVFERFLSRRDTGTGLGLALVRAVAESHGGSAEAENDHGAVVTVRLPLAP